MKKLFFVLALNLWASIGTTSEEINSSVKFSCDRQNPGFYIFRGMTLPCNPVNDNSLTNICNFYPKSNTSGPCVPREKLCDVYFECQSGDLIIGEGKHSCPKNYKCNNSGEDYDCTPCIRKKCSTPTTQTFKCLNETTAVQNGEYVQCNENSICNAEYVEPCNRPCVSINPYNEYYINILRSLSISGSPRQG